MQTDVGTPPHFAGLLAKYDANGTNVFARQFGTGFDRNVKANAIAFDKEQRLLLAGGANSSVFSQLLARDFVDGGIGAASADVWAARFGLDGALVWGEQFGAGGWPTAGQGIACDPATGNAIVVGSTQGNLLGTNPGAGGDVFVKAYAPQPAAPPAQGAPLHLRAVMSLTEAAAAPAVDTSKWFLATSGNASITQSGGTINLSLFPSTPTSQAIVQSNDVLDLTNSEAGTQVRSVVSRAGGVNAVFTLQVDWNNQLNWWFEQGFLYGNYFIGGVQHPVATLTYDASKHAWWRIRESAGTVWWETSADGKVWDRQASVPSSSLFSLKGLQLILHAREFGSGNPNPGMASFTNVNPPIY